MQIVDDDYLNSLVKMNIDGATIQKHVSNKEEIDYKNEAIPWPNPLQEAAYHGLAGDFVKEVIEYTEADPAAILTNVLVSFGSISGRNLFWEVSGSRHFTNLYAAIVGSTARGKKGTSWSYPKILFSKVDNRWVYCGGLSSSEGVLYQIRDGVSTAEEEEEIPVDRGVSDKRWLVLESEFASVLRQQRRSGNTLSEYLRKFWDSDLQIKALTRNSPLTVTKGHISLIGHVTKTELKNTFGDESILNGLGNRFIWVCSRQSKFLPLPPQFPNEKMETYVQRFIKAVRFAQEARMITFTEPAKHYYVERYQELTCERPGLFGAAIARRCPIILRLAMIYAAIDMCVQIDVIHLQAALAFWDYCEQSAKYIFGQGSERDPVAEKIIEFLKGKENGATQTEVSGFFNRNKSATEIKAALEKLSANGAIFHQDVKTTGRTKRLWKLATEQK